MVCPWHHQLSWGTTWSESRTYPFGSFTCLGDAGTAVNPVNFRNLELTKLWLLPLSTNNNMTLFCTNALSLMQSEWSAANKVCRDNWPNSSCKESSIANWFKTSSVRFTSKSLTTKAFNCCLGLLEHFLAWPVHIFQHKNSINHEPSCNLVPTFHANKDYWIWCQVYSDDPLVWAAVQF